MNREPSGRRLFRDVRIDEGQRMTCSRFLIALTCGVLPLSLAGAEPTGGKSTPASVNVADLAAAAGNGTKHALILCGHPGDKDHRKPFADTVEKLHKALVDRYGFTASRIHVEFGAPVAEGDGPVLAGLRGSSSR